ncbi:hypothetical protein RRG08_014007 [Elysia crispata]|uniref:Uncharacterized protein n=1 Tax=Elysia crispata TaxID=231223 RepID=A0AAE1B231_9GAST|nr:hypothetical protein RRG08_014007 [Elysia crispata]
MSPATAPNRRRQFMRHSRPQTASVQRPGVPAWRNPPEILPYFLATGKKLLQVSMGRLGNRDRYPLPNGYFKLCSWTEVTSDGRSKDNTVTVTVSVAQRVAFEGCCSTLDSTILLGKHGVLVRTWCVKTISSTVCRSTMTGMGVTDHALWAACTESIRTFEETSVFDSVLQGCCDLKIRHSKVIL